jgi:release factor glutamine methyltransferase
MQSLWQWRQDYLREHPDMAQELDQFLRQAVGWSPLHGLTHRDPPGLDPEATARVIRLWQEHLVTEIPIAYALEQVTWRDFTLRVSPGVLIPRPETELLVDLVLAWLQAQEHAQDQVGAWADLGTGSGAIALGLAAAGIPKVYAVDLSPEALAVARINVERYHKQDQIHLRQGNWFEPLADVAGSLQGVVANPPYIPSALIPTLDPGVRDYEPHMALDGGETGLAAIEILVQQAPIYLQSGGFWAVEVMIGQAPRVADLLAADGRYRQITITPDLAGIPRFVSAVCQ